MLVPLEDMHLLEEKGRLLDMRELLPRELQEELHAMYAEGKSPQTAAEIIDGRVQLYLDEGK